MKDAPYPLDALNFDAMTLEDIEETKTALATLTSYAGSKIAAMKARQAGAIDNALWAERRCDQIYNHELPDNWKW